MILKIAYIFVNKYSQPSAKILVLHQNTKIDSSSRHTKGVRTGTTKNMELISNSPFLIKLQ